MAKTIGQLTQATTIASGDEFVIEQSGLTKRVAASVVRGGLVNADIDAAAAIAGSKLADGGIVTAKIADANVTTAKIADANITAAKLSGAQTGSAPIYGCRAWVNFDPNRNEADTEASTNGANVKIRANGNVASVLKNGTGDYTVTFTTAMPNANYVVCATSATTGTSSNALIAYELNAGSRSTTAVRIAVGNNEADVFTEPQHGVSVMILG